MKHWNLPNPAVSYKDRLQTPSYAYKFSILFHQHSLKNEKIGWNHEHSFDFAHHRHIICLTFPLRILIDNTFESVGFSQRIKLDVDRIFFFRFVFLEQTFGRNQGAF